MGKKVISNEYAAGFFDGEGSVYANSRNNGRQPTVLVCISNTHEGILKLHQERWGGSISGKQIKSERHRPLWQWVLAPKNAARFLRDVYPHLVIKREVAGYALEWIAEMERPTSEKVVYERIVRVNGTVGTRPQVLPDHRSRVDAIVAKMRTVNARGFNALRRVDA